MKAPTTPYPPAPPRHLVTENPAYTQWVENFATALCVEAEHDGPKPCLDCVHCAREYGNATARPAAPVA